MGLFLRICLVLLLIAFPGFSQGRQTDNCTISIQARLFFKNGPEAIPPNREYYVLLSHRTFYLMDVDPAEALKAAGLKYPEQRSYGLPDEVSGREWLEVFLEGTKSNFTGGASHLREFYSRAFAILKPHRIQRLETDSDGKGTFQAVRPGIYYVMGEAGEGYPQIWNLRVEANKPAISVVLEEGNRMRAISK
jgi:hypothetical protein